MGEVPGTVERDEERRPAEPDGGAAPEVAARDADAEEQAERAERTDSGAGRGESTVQLRVRIGDSPTTMLRLPADSPTRMLRLPIGVDEGKRTDGAEPAEEPAAASTGETTAGVAGEGAREGAEKAAAAPGDPRLALRSDRAPSGAQKAAGGTVPDRGAPAEDTAAEDTPKTGATDTDDEAAGDTPDPADAPADAAPAADERSDDAPPAATSSAEAKPEAKPEATPEATPEAKPEAKPEATPEEQEPPATELSLPTVTPPPPAPVEAKGKEQPPATEVSLPAVTTPPAPAPAPVYEPEPLSVPETTSEAMQVLASLSARPMTPLRRAVKRITVWSLFLAFVLGIVCVAQLLRPLPDPELKSAAAASYAFPGGKPDLPWPTEGQAAAEVYGLGSLGRSGADKAAPMASVTKVMTAYVVLRDHPLKLGENGPTLTADKQAASEYSSGLAEGESVVKVKEGQKVGEYEALQMLLIPSANNIARLLGRWDAGSQGAFVKKMNETARALGMSKTVYTDPSGLQATTVTTAGDQLKLAEKVMQDDVFRQIVATPNVVLSDGQKIYNNNQLLTTGDHVIGVKTGSSTPAGGCLMWAAEKQVGGTTQLIIGVVMGQQGTQILQKALDVSGALIAGAQKNLTDRTVLRKGDVVGYADDGLGGRVPVEVTKDVTVAGWSGISVDVDLVPAAGLPHHAEAGTRVGTVTTGSGEGEVKVPVVLQRDLAPPSIGSRLTRLL